MLPEEFVLSIAGVEIAGKRWRNDAQHSDAQRGDAQRNGKRPVLALHGWLDNAASFDKLAPLLDADIVALDLAGHGLSYHRTPQATYNVWDDLADIVRVADRLGWSQFYLLGHSRGAIIAGLLTAALPERILGSIFLDGLTPPPLPIAETFTQLGRHLREHLAEPKVAARYESLQRALEVRCRVGKISEVAARPIVERGLKVIDNEWVWRADPRLHLASALKLNAGQIDLLAQEIAKLPNLLLLAEGGYGARMRSNGDLEKLPLDWQFVPGSHHFHLEDEAALIAERINAFWSADVC
jgi:pimeloyl-ACP methyl ester carboxylesterase